MIYGTHRCEQKKPPRWKCSSHGRFWYPVNLLQVHFLNQNIRVKYSSQDFLSHISPPPAVSDMPEDCMKILSTCDLRNSINRKSALNRVYMLNIFLVIFSPFHYANVNMGAFQMYKHLFHLQFQLSAVLVVTKAGECSEGLTFKNFLSVVIILFK